MARKRKVTIQQHVELAQAFIPAARAMGEFTGLVDIMFGYYSKSSRAARKIHDLIIEMKSALEEDLDKLIPEDARTTIDFPLSLYGRLHKLYQKEYTPRSYFEMKEIAKWNYDERDSPMTIEHARAIYGDSTHVHLYPRKLPSLYSGGSRGSEGGEQ